MVDYICMMKTLRDHIVTISVIILGILILGATFFGGMLGSFILMGLVLCLFVGVVSLALLAWGHAILPSRNKTLDDSRPTPRYSLLSKFFFLVCVMLLLLFLLSPYL